MLVTNLAAGDASAMEALYATFAPGLRLLVLHELGGQDAGDMVHDILMAVIDAIKKGHVRQPEGLPSFVRTVAKRKIWDEVKRRIDQRGAPAELPDPVAMDSHSNPEQHLHRLEQVELMKETLRSLPPRQQRVLVSFYLEEKTPAQICEEMGLSETQFRLCKSRAKDRFARLGKRRLARRPALLGSRAAIVAK